MATAWAGNDIQPDLSLSRVPDTAIALVSGNLDAPALYQAIRQIVPDEDQPKLKNLETLLGGLLLGQDLKTQILPQVGPGLVAYVESAPEFIQAGPGAAEASTSASTSSPFAQVLVVSLRKEGGGVTPAAAIENALRTVLALAALDAKRNDGRSEIVSRSVAGSNVISLNPPVPFAYAVDVSGSRLIVGTSATAVARCLEAASNPRAGERFRRFRSRAFPDATTFFCAT